MNESFRTTIYSVHFAAMFVTNTNFKSPVSALFASSGEKYWIAAELASAQPWFLISVKQYEKPGSDAAIVTRTLLVADAVTLEDILQANEGSLAVIHSVQLISPSYLNGSKQWKMEELSAVWAARDMSNDDQGAHIFVTVQGAKLAHSLIGTSLEMLVPERVIFLLPQPNEDSAVGH